MLARVTLTVLKLRATSLSLEIAEFLYIVEHTWMVFQLVRFAIRSESSHIPCVQHPSDS